MCGICGIHAPGRAADPTTLGEMLGTIVHRGPDDDGVHVDGEVALGARRLSIIDVPGGHQPITNEDGTIAVAYNGEIYNFRALRDRLRRSGHTLRTNGDTEVIVHLYEELGDDCVHELEGMFAFALWDARRCRLLLARDRLGVKPLYYTKTTSDDVLFASEIKALVQHPGCVSRLDPAALAAFLHMKYVPAPRTMFAGISALAPGHLLVSDRNGVRIRRWWDVSFHRGDGEPTEEEAAEGLRERLVEAVRSHLVSDVPFGAFLSGGLDSSTVVALMAGEMRRPVTTFAVGYQGVGEDLSELPYARLISQRFGTDHHEVFLEARHLVERAEEVVWHLDQPIADEACVATLLVAELAASHVKMVLTGEGGDELFAGYARYAGEQAAPVVAALPSRLRHAARRLSVRSPGLTRPRIALYALTQPDELNRLATWFPLMRPEMRAELAVGELAEAVLRLPPAGLYGNAFSRADGPDAVSRLSYVDLKLWLPDDLLARGDKMSMAVSLENRVPLLDHRLVEYAAGLPPRFKVRGLSRKYLLRKVAAEWLPEPILKRRKKGFPVPMGAWLRGEAHEFCHDMLAPGTIARRGIFDQHVVGRLLREHDSGAANHGSVLWALVSVELWHRLFIDGARAARTSALETT